MAVAVTVARVVATVVVEMVEAVVVEVDTATVVVRKVVVIATLCDISNAQVSNHYESRYCLHTCSRTLYPVH